MKTRYQFRRINNKEDQIQNESKNIFDDSSENSIVKKQQDQFAYLKKVRHVVESVDCEDDTILSIRQRSPSISMQEIPEADVEEPCAE